MRRAIERASVVLLPAVGLWLTFGPVLRSSFTTVPTSPGDIRLIGYLLEHGYRWLTGDPAHAAFWNAPFFYPLRNTVAYTETFLGAAPLYWLPRLLGAPAHVALDVWLMLQFAADYAVFAWFVRRRIGATLLASATGAYLFAFAGMRLYQLGHAQLVGHFFTILAIDGLWQVVTVRGPARVRGLALFVSMAVLQVYAGFYLGWFLALALVLALVAALLRPTGRRSLAEAAADLRTPGAAAIVALGIAAIAPLGLHYLQASHTLGMRPYAEVQAMIPGWRSWLDMGPTHWLYGGLHRTLRLEGIELEVEHRIGLGFLTIGLAAVGLWQSRRARWALWLYLPAAALLVLALKVHGLSAWALVFQAVPAGGAIRAVTRISLLLLVPASVALAVGLDTLGRRRILVAVVLAAAVVAEQRVPVPAYDVAPLLAREAALAAEVGQSCRAFVYTPTAPCGDAPWAVRHGAAVDAHLDAMAVSTITGIPTLNGYSGSLPPGYPFWALTACSPDDAITIPRLIRTWCASHGCRASSVCWIH